MGAPLPSWVKVLPTRYALLSGELPLVSSLRGDTSTTQTSASSSSVPSWVWTWGLPLLAGAAVGGITYAATKRGETSAKVGAGVFGVTLLATGSYALNHMFDKVTLTDATGKKETFTKP